MMIQLAGLVLVAALSQAPAAQPPADQSQSARDAFAPAAALDDRQLAGLTGGQEPVSSQWLSATNSGNTLNAAGSITSGIIDISSGALENFAGIGNFVFNTGANNNLQGDITVNIVNAPAP